MIFYKCKCHYYCNRNSLSWSWIGILLHHYPNENGIASKESHRKITFSGTDLGCNIEYFYNTDTNYLHFFPLTKDKGIIYRMKYF